MTRDPLADPSVTTRALLETDPLVRSRPSRASSDRPVPPGGSPSAIPRLHPGRRPARHRAPRSNLLQWVLVWLLCAAGLSASSAQSGELSQLPHTRTVDLRLPDLTGGQRSLSEFAGKWVLINFWASWCTPCIAEMPSIQRLAKQMADKPFAVIGVNVAESQRRVQRTAARLGLEFPILLDEDSAVFDGWGATVLPTTYLLDGAGRMRYIGRGPLEWDGVEVVTLIQELMSEAEDPRP